VVITGASGGIGQGLLRELLKKGYMQLVALCHIPEHAKPIERLLEEYDIDPKKHVLFADIAKEEEVVAAFSDIAEKLGSVFALINNAGISSNNVSWKLSGEEFRRIHEVNLFGSFYASKAALQQMRPEQRGRIINISSILSQVGIAGTSHYSASKAGLNAMTRTMAQEVAHKSITVNAIALGYFDAGMIHSVPAEKRESIRKSIPIGRFGRVAELASLIDYLLQESSSYLTGQVIHLNGGLH